MTNSGQTELQSAAIHTADDDALLLVEDLTSAYGDRVIQEHVSFTVRRGEIFVIMGGSGCGKSTLLRHLVGLKAPRSGTVMLLGENLWDISPEQRDALVRRAGVLYQGGALWSSMTVAENIALPLREYTPLPRSEIRDLVEWKLALVGLGGFGGLYPSELSGGMRKRAGLARALALEPEVLFFDEPSAGLDPVSSRRLDDLIQEIATSLNAAVILVTHELQSIFAIGTNSVFLDGETKTVRARGNPRQLLESSADPVVQRFLRREG